MNMPKNATMPPVKNRINHQLSGVNGASERLQRSIQNPKGSGA
jgi:hypothetical protein